MDLNLEYAAHQNAIMAAKGAANDDDRNDLLAKAGLIAGRISNFQHGLGAAAACAWSHAQLAQPADAGPEPRPAF
jgi:hypothetical protein